MNLGIEISRKIALAYSSACKPLCAELELSQTAFDILMFLGNNPRYKTAADIVELRHLKANSVSVNVEKLVQEGYITRQTVESDRRKTLLICTDKAKPLIKRGRKLQNDFFEKLFTDTDDETRAAFSAALQMIDKNLDEMLKAKD